MWEILLKYLGIYLVCLVKFIAGPALGFAAGLNIFGTMSITVAGMMTTVIALSFASDFFKRRILSKFKSQDSKKRFSPKNRRIVTFWKKYGVNGVAALTPLFFTPIGGTLIMTSFGVPKRQIISTMFISAVIWSVIFTLSIEQILEIPLIARFIPQA
ncbi:hypothetical protein [Penaeicola halotolerans]|uniref:hypothetical protein n=1 Tax=Penaeicola halotolerans TaxID=2793196 RepID=UPI001CF800E7|nr:hypothetical protein [Penaeicola halotolerans]